MTAFNRHQSLTYANIDAKIQLNVADHISKQKAIYYIYYICLEKTKGHNYKKMNHVSV